MPPRTRDAAVLNFQHSSGQQKKPASRPGLLRGLGENMLINHATESAIPRQRDFRLFVDSGEMIESRPCPVAADSESSATTNRRITRGGAADAPFTGARPGRPPLGREAGAMTKASSIDQNPLKGNDRNNFESAATQAANVRGSALSVFKALLEFCWGKSDCFPSVSKLVDKSGFSESVVQRRLRELNNSGAIVIVVDRSIRTQRRYIIAGHPHAISTLETLLRSGSIRSLNPELPERLDRLNPTAPRGVDLTAPRGVNLTPESQNFPENQKRESLKTNTCINASPYCIPREPEPLDARPFESQGGGAGLAFDRSIEIRSSESGSVVGAKPPILDAEPIKPEPTEAGSAAMGEIFGLDEIGRRLREIIGDHHGTEVAGRVAEFMEDARGDASILLGAACDVARAVAVDGNVENPIGLLRSKIKRAVDFHDLKRKRSKPPRHEFLIDRAIESFRGGHKHSKPELADMLDWIWRGSGSVGLCNGFLDFNHEASLIEWQMAFDDAWDREKRNPSIEYVLAIVRGRAAETSKTPHAGADWKRPTNAIIDSGASVDSKIG